MRIKWVVDVLKLLRTVPKRIVFTSAHKILRKRKKERKKSGDDVTKIRAHLWGISPYGLRHWTLFLAKSWKANPGKYSSAESYFVNKITNTEKKWLMNPPEKSAMSLREHCYMWNIWRQTKHTHIVSYITCYSSGLKDECFSFSSVWIRGVISHRKNHDYCFV